MRVVIGTVFHFLGEKDGFARCGDSSVDRIGFTFIWAMGNGGWEFIIFWCF